MEIIERHPGDTFLMIRASYVDICNGNIVAAALIHIFEQWHLVKIKARDQERRKVSNGQSQKDILIEGLYQWHTAADLERQLMGLAKRDKIQEARTQLVSMGIISEHKNPNPKYSFDKTTYFVFYPDAVSNLLTFRREPSADIHPSLSQKSERVTENRQRETENRDYTYTTSIDNDIDNSKEVSGAGAPVDRKPDKPADKKKKVSPPAEKDTDWQRWVDRYEDHVKKHNGDIGHNWNGAQLGGSGLKGLRRHLVKVSTKVEGKSDEDCGFGAWCYILDHWDKLGDDWIAGQFDLTVILKKITEILNRLRNATNENRGLNSAKSGTSEKRVAALKDY